MKSGETVKLKKGGREGVLNVWISNHKKWNVIWFDDLSNSHHAESELEVVDEGHNNHIKGARGNTINARDIIGDVNFYGEGQES